MSRYEIPDVYADASKPKVFSCRAECEADVTRFVELLRVTCQSQARVFVAKPEEWVSDVLVEVHAKPDMSYETILSTCRMVPDGHVMLQTMRPVPVTRNSLERNHERK